MIWIALGIVAAVVVLALIASFFLRFRVTPGGEKRPGSAPPAQLGPRQHYVIRSSDGEERSFSSLEEMPEELRALVEKADRKSVQTRIVIVRDGRREEYDSLDAVPEDVRKHLR